MDNDLVVQFCSVTGASTDDAAQYLEMSEGDMERAVALFLDMGSMANQGASSPHDTLSSGGYNPALFQDDDVREAIPAQFDQLIGGPQFGGSQFSSMTDWIQGAISSDAAFRADAVRDEFVQAGLGEMYAPPDDINFTGTLADAMKEAKETRKWLLINLQDSSEFATQVLNRDVWRHETVREVIKSSFLFWQRDKTSPQGSAFVTSYQITCFPVVCIIDPRTGRKAKLWTSDKFRGPFVATDLLADFMGSNPYGSKISKQEDKAVVIDKPAERIIDVVEDEVDGQLSVPSLMPSDFAPTGADEAVRVAIRLSTGSKQQVSFKASDPLSIIQQWISATEQVPIAQLQVRHGHPPAILDFSLTCNIKDANLAGALLSVAKI